MKKQLVGIGALILLLLSGCGNNVSSDTTYMDQESGIPQEGISDSEVLNDDQDNDAQTKIPVGDFTNALTEAQDKRIGQLTQDMKQYIGSWKCQELIMSMAIGQDSTRSLLGIDLLDANVEIFDDFTARVNGEDYDITDVMVTDQSWYYSGLAIVPQHTAGLIVEIFYQHNDKLFSAYFAENGLSFCSYAYGYYSAKRVDDLNGSEEAHKGEDVGSRVADMVRAFYLERYGEPNQQLTKMLGPYHGYECVVQENMVAYEGNHTLEISLEDGNIQVFFDEEALGTEQVQVFSSISLSYMQGPDLVYIPDPYLQELEIPDEDRKLLKAYREHYIIVLGSGEMPTILLVEKYDNKYFQNPSPITLYKEGIVYDFYNE